MEQIDRQFCDAFEAAGIIVHDGKTYNFRGSEYHLSILKSRAGHWGIFYTGEYTEDGEIWFDEAPRHVLKASAERIVPLLTKYSKTLESKLMEYHDVSNMVERMNTSMMGE